MIEVYIFRSLDAGYGLTIKKSGKNLPENIGPWTPIKSIEIRETDGPRIGATLSSIEMYRIIEREGYCLENSSLEI